MRTYTTTQGDTWDEIALRFFPDAGAEKLMHSVLEVNAPLRHRVVFSAGEVVNIPDVDIPVVSNRPPWRR